MAARWTRDEILLVLDLYIRSRGVNRGPTDEAVQQVASALGVGRTVAAVRSMVACFQPLDPTRGSSNQRRGTVFVRSLWKQFGGRHKELRAEARRARSRLAGGAAKNRRGEAKTKRATSHRRVVAVRVGWMTWYDLEREPDGPDRGGSYNRNAIGSEANNFRPHRDRCTGYVRTGHHDGFNLRRLGDSATDERVSDLLVLIFATPPRGGQRLVGWYGRATCLAEARDRPGGLEGAYNFEAAANDCRLLPVSHRTVEAPARGAGGFGQASVRYARDARGRLTSVQWMNEAVKFAEQYRGPCLLRDGGDPGELPHAEATLADRGQGRALSAAERSAVELRAMSVAVKFFRAGGWAVFDVSGTESFDLRCRRSESELRVEVKGTTGKPDTVILTRNEVVAAQDTRTRSALFVVSGIALTVAAGKPRARGGKAGWIRNWMPSDDRLRPTQFQYRLPRLQPVK